MLTTRQAPSRGFRLIPLDSHALRRGRDYRHTTCDTVIQVGEARSISMVPHCVRHFLSCTLCPSELGHAPGIKNAPGKAGSTIDIDLRRERLDEPTLTYMEINWLIVWWTEVTKGGWIKNVLQLLVYTKVREIGGHGIRKFLEDKCVLRVRFGSWGIFQICRWKIKLKITIYAPKTNKKLPYFPRPAIPRLASK